MCVYYLECVCVCVCAFTYWVNRKLGKLSYIVSRGNFLIVVFVVWTKLLAVAILLLATICVHVSLESDLIG